MCMCIYVIYVCVDVCEWTLKFFIDDFSQMTEYISIMRTLFDAFIRNLKIISFGSYYRIVLMVCHEFAEK